MFVPFDPEEMIALLEGHTPCFSSTDTIFVEAPCAACGYPTIPEVNPSKPFIGRAINYALKCTQCNSRTNPISLALMS